MSARGLGTAINPFGNYPTPPHLFHRFAEALRAAGETWLDDAEVIDEPCAGEGVLVGAIRAECPKARIYASDIREGLLLSQYQAGADATLKARRDAAEQAAKRAREDAARVAVQCIHCPHGVLSHAVDDEERRGCGEPFCGCVQYECAEVQP